MPNIIAFFWGGKEGSTKLALLSTSSGHLVQIRNAAADGVGIPVGGLSTAQKKNNTIKVIKRDENRLCGSTVTAGRLQIVESVLKNIFWGDLVYF